MMMMSSVNKQIEIVHTSQITLKTNSWEVRMEILTSKWATSSGTHVDQSDTEHILSSDIFICTILQNTIFFTLKFILHIQIL